MGLKQTFLPEIIPNYTIFHTLEYRIKINICKLPAKNELKIKSIKKFCLNKIN